MTERIFQKLPRHLAIIMDGNGRWAQRRSLPRIEGHKKGAENVRRIVEACRRWGIEVLTLYAFSQENWQRPKEEVEALMDLLVEFLQKERDEMAKNGISLRVIGCLDELPLHIQDILLQTIEATSAGRDMILNLALSYSGRSEILRAFERYLKEAKEKGIEPTSLTEESFSQYLDTKGLPEPDLLIRTSGEQRISNFLLWQLAYTEIFFTDTLWPDFSEEELAQALLDYQRRERRFGRVTGQARTVSVC